MEKPAYQTLVDFWTASKFDINFGPTSPAAIAELEEKYAVKLPSSFRDYLLHACPVGVDQIDRDFTTWWSLDCIIREEHERLYVSDTSLGKENTPYVIFADYAVMAWSWAICCKPGNNYGRIIQFSETVEFVSNSFEAFIQAYTELYEHTFILPKLVKF